jgi:hypothetical protein
MQCPRCTKKKMTPGHVRFCEPTMFGPRQRIGSFMFEPDNGELITPKVSGTSYYCPACETIVMPGVFERLTCFDCGKVIDEEVDACPACGWTWK